MFYITNFFADISGLNNMFYHLNMKQVYHRLQQDIKGLLIRLSVLFFAHHSIFVFLDTFTLMGFLLERDNIVLNAVFVFASDS